MHRFQQALVCAVVVLCMPHAAQAQRELHWESIDVAATLDDSGILRIVETQTMVFTGDWNGGERRFNIRPRQKLSFISIARFVDGEWRAMRQDADLDEVDEYAFTETHTLRWRSRRPDDLPFAGTAVRYQLSYELSGILSKTDDGFLLDHDFAFPDRDGIIERFGLNLTLGSNWAPRSAQREVYTAESLPPGHGFVVTLPLRYTGAGVPAVLEDSRPREIVMAVSLLFGVAAVAVLWFFAREQSYGRFAPLPGPVDEAWLRDHILDYPAEVVGAAWDESIGAPEVVALIARMVSEGKLESEVGGGSSMALRLKVDRATLEGHERTLVERLFFNGRSKTNTELVKEHYRKDGFNPAQEIKSELQTRVDAALPGGRKPRTFALAGILQLVGFGLLALDWYAGALPPVAAWAIGIAGTALSAVSAGVGLGFRRSIHHGRGAAVANLTPGLVTIAAVAWFLWYYAGRDIVTVSPTFAFALVILALAVLFAATDAMKSRQHRAAIAFRKRLAAARAHFISELAKEEPALRDQWMPWVLAFGLGKHIDDWSARQSAPTTDNARWAGSSSSSSDSSSERWTGFGGGRSGGGGGGASWAAAAGGLAAGVAPPSSSGSSGGGGGGSSSSGGSSGGGGGGGW